MVDLGITGLSPIPSTVLGLSRGKKTRTTRLAPAGQQPADLVKRNFKASAPNRLWVADLTYVATWAGFGSVGFAIVAYSRLIVGWVTTWLSVDLALDTLKMAILTRSGEHLHDLVYHSNRGVQSLSIRYSERLAEAGGDTLTSSWPPSGAAGNVNGEPTGSGGGSIYEG